MPAPELVLCIIMLAAVEPGGAGGLLPGLGIPHAMESS